MKGNFGKYELKSLLGKGSSGTVNHAVDTFSGDEVAVKVIDPAVFQDPEFGRVLRKQFLKEASLAGTQIESRPVVLLRAAGCVVAPWIRRPNLVAVGRPECGTAEGGGAT